MFQDLTLCELEDELNELIEQKEFLVELIEIAKNRIDTLNDELENLHFNK